jgi:hypothetical protein
MTVGRRKDRPRSPLMGTLQQPAAGNNSLRQTVIAGQSKLSAGDALRSGSRRKPGVLPLHAMLQFASQWAQRSCAP